MAKKATSKVAKAEVDTSAVEQAAEFTPCSQCGNPGDCARAVKCVRGFK